MSIHLANLKENPFPADQSAWEDLQRALLWFMLVLIGIPVIVWLLFQKEQSILVSSIATIGLTAWLITPHRHLAAAAWFVGF